MENKATKLEIERFGSFGEGVARDLSGKIVFVPFTLPGEIVEVEMVEDKKNFLNAKLVRVEKSAKNRCIPECPHFEKCGGCDLQHISYDEQLKLKAQIVENNLSKIAKVDCKVFECEPSPKAWGYRNKIAFSISGDCVGMLAGSSHMVVPVEKCFLAEAWAHKVAVVVNAFLQKFAIPVWDEKTRQGLLRHVVARYLDRQLLVTMVVNGDKLPHAKELFDMLCEHFSNVGLFLNVNRGKNSEILTDVFVHLFGISQIETKMNGIYFWVSPGSFLQVNSDVASRIYDEVCREIAGTRVVNAYSGAGLLSAMLAKKAEQVFAIEIVKSAHQDAEKLKKKNGIQNLSNICGDVVRELEKCGNFDAIVLDPPRKGCDKRVLDKILEVCPQKIVYVSCDSATLARDVAVLKEKYAITKVQPFDMFPQTRHVETLLVLEKE